MRERYSRVGKAAQAGNDGRAWAQAEAVAEDCAELAEHHIFRYVLRVKECRYGHVGKTELASWRYISWLGIESLK